MKKIITLVELTFFIAAMPLLVYAEMNHTKLNCNQHVNVPDTKNGYLKNENIQNAGFENGVPGLPGTGLIFINY